MSALATAHVWRIPAPDALRVLLLAIADQANDTGFAAVSVASLSERTGKPEDAVRAQLEALRSAGALSPMTTGISLSLRDLDLDLVSLSERERDGRAPARPRTRARIEHSTPALSEEDRAALIAKFGDRVTDVEVHIEDALGHPAAAKRKNLRAYVSVWLNRAADFEAERKQRKEAPHAQTHRSANGHSRPVGSDKLAAILR